jgi:hypothetical protein
MAQVLVPFFRRYVDKDMVPDTETPPPVQEAVRAETLEIQDDTQAAQGQALPRESYPEAADAATDPPVVLKANEAGIK